MMIETDETPRVQLCKIGIMRLLGMRYPTLGDGEIFKRAASHIDAILEALEAPTPPKLTEPVAGDATGE